MTFEKFKKSIAKISFLNKTRPPNSTRRGAKVHQNERKYRELADSLPQIIFETDENFNLTFLNDNAINVFGYDQKDFAKGVKFCDLFLRSEGHNDNCGEKVRKTRSACSCEKVAKRKNGSTFPALVHASPIFDGGIFRGMRGLIINISKEKEAEMLLKESEEKYREIIENSNDLIYAIDKSGKFIYINKATKKYTGYEIEELRKINFSKVTYHEDIPTVTKVFYEALSGKTQNCNVRGIRSDGNIFYISVNVIPLRKNNDIEGVICFARDVTREKEAEKLLKESEEKYRNIIENSKDLIWKLDKDGKYTYVNSAVIKLCGNDYKITDILGKHFSIFVFPKDNDRMMEVFKRTLGGESINYEIEVPIRNRNNMIMSVSTSPIIEKRQIVGIVSFGRDITIERESQKLLKESEERYRAIIENSNDLVWTLDTNGKFTYYNKKAQNVTGYGANEFIGRSFTPLIKPKDISRITEIVKRALAGETQHYEVDVLKKNGEYLSLSVNISPRYESGKIVGTASFGRDITAKKQTQNKLKQEQAFRAAIENSITAGIIATDLEGKVIYVNNAFLKVTGYSRSEIIGDPVPHKYWLDSETKKTLDKFKKLPEISSVNHPFTTETKFVCKDGSLLDIQSITAPLLDKDGKKIGWLASVSDISERKKMEESLQEQLAFINAVEVSILAGIAVVDMEGKMIYVNRAFTNMVGWTQEELVGKKAPFVFWHPDQAKLIQQNFDKKVTGEIPAGGFELKFRHKNGKILYVHGLHSQLVYADNKKIGTLAVFYDITSRKKQGEELRKMKKAVEYSGEIIFMTDPDGIITYINPEFTKAYGYTKDEVVGKETYKILRSHQVSNEEHDRMKKSILEKQAIKLKLRNKTKDGTLLEIIDYTNPILDDKNNLIGFLAIQHKAED